MGTNFYWIYNPNNLDKDHPKIHIGKRSAAGLYCYDCGIYLTAESTQYAHMQESFKKEIQCITTKSFDGVCPNCGKSRQKDSFSSAFKELGFDQPKTELTGVQGCSSFTWTMMLHKSRITELLTSDDKVIIDEYGKEFSAVEFLNELKYTPIEFQMHCEFS